MMEAIFDNILIFMNDNIFSQFNTKMSGKVPIFQAFVSWPMLIFKTVDI